MAWNNIEKDNKPTAYDVGGVKGRKWVCRSNEEWRAERSRSFGASEVGALLGISHFATPLSVVRTKRDEQNGLFSYEETDAMLIGHLFEGGVAGWLEKKHGYEIIESSAAEYLLRRDDMPFLHVSPDRMCWLDQQGPKSGKNSELNKAIVECKTTSMPVDGDNLPVSWIFQLHTQMGVSGYHKGFIVWFSFSTRTFGFRMFDFDEEIFNAAANVCRDTWERCIEGDEDPEPVNAQDILLLYPQHTIGKTITVNNDTTTAISELKELKEARKKIDDAIDQYADRLKAQFTDEEAMVDNGGRVLCTYKTNSRGMRQLLIK